MRLERIERRPPTPSRPVHGHATSGLRPASGRAPYRKARLVMTAVFQELGEVEDDTAGDDGPALARADPQPCAVFD